uniref:Secreted protein n=1 Tax=Oryza glaberrima TaxID=4538 RepID=I1R2A9_ORYGL
MRRSMLLQSFLIWLSSRASCAFSRMPPDATPPEPEPDGACGSMSGGLGEELEDMTCSSPDSTEEPSRVIIGSAIGIAAATVTAPVVVVAGTGGVPLHLPSDNVGLSPITLRRRRRRLLLDPLIRVTGLVTPGSVPRWIGCQLACPSSRCVAALGT